MTFLKSFSLFTFRYKKQIFIFNAFFWPLLAGIVSYSVLVPQYPTERLDGVEAQRIRTMLEDVKLKTREEKLDDALHAMKYFMIPNQGPNSSAVATATEQQKPKNG